MANYLYLVATDEIAARVENWLGTTQDVHSENLPSSCRILFVGREEPDGDAFLGYVIDHEKGCIFFGPDKSLDPAKPTEGCYFHARINGNEVVIGHDIFAQMGLLYFSETGVFAASDSLFILTELRKALGIPCRIDEDVMRGRSWSNGMAAQLLNTRTPIVGISFSGPGTHLKINAAGGNPVLTEFMADVPSLFQSDVTDYADTILEAACRTSSVIRSLMEVSGATVSIGLSGGFDSRVCLAAALNASEHDDPRLAINSNAARESDFTVAKSLSKTFGFRLNDACGGFIREWYDQLSSWMLSCAGIYDPLYCRRSVQRWDNRFSVGGHGAEVYKGNYGWRTIQSVGNRTKCPVVEVVRDQCEIGLEAMRVDPCDPWGTEWHYLCFRNPIHSGRSTMTTLFGSRPLLQRKLVGLSRSDINELKAPKKNQPSIVSDLLIALNPDLAAAPFDNAEKNLDIDYIRERTSRLGGAISKDDVEVYMIVGEPSRAYGFPAVFLRMAKEKGFSGPFRNDRIRPILGEAVEKIPACLMTDYVPLIEVAKSIEDPILMGSRNSMACGKLATFLLAD